MRKRRFLLSAFLAWVCLALMLPEPTNAGWSAMPAESSQGRLPEAPSAQSFPGLPAYDSGWVSLAPDGSRTLLHNLGGSPEDYVVDMIYQTGGVDGINLRYYGGADFGTQPAPGHLENDRVGAYWRSLTANSLVVYRRPEDTYAELVRVRIWVDPSPNYDSGWVDLAAGGAAVTLNHNLGGNPDSYLVKMDYRTPDVNGINQRYYGGADFGAQPAPGHQVDDRVGTYWRSLTGASITLFRRAEDDYSPQARIRIWVRPKPTYDSGWVAVNPDQAITLSHKLGGDPQNYLMDMQFRSSGADGVNQRHLGGADFGAHPAPGGNVDDRVGAYWRSLDSAAITIYRRPEDLYAEQIRLRIWNTWEPSHPDYDSGWVALGPGGAATTLTHNLGGSADGYWVDTQYRGGAEDGINLRYYGGADFGTQPAPGHNPDDRVGAYWRSLTNASITLFRRDEDTYAPEVRIRIWQAPKPDFDSGWLALAQDASQVLAHALGGDPANYLVDLQYRSPGDGINQRYYGGADFGSHPVAGTNPDDRMGAYWRSLTASGVIVYRRPDDIYAPQVRLRIWRAAPPDYDSGWVSLDPDVAQVLHTGLVGAAPSYLVNMWQSDGGGANGINQRHLGGADFGANPAPGHLENDRVGAYWRTLTAGSVTVYRRPEDTYAQQVRIRIWNYSNPIYLPVIWK